STMTPLARAVMRRLLSATWGVSLPLLFLCAAVGVLLGLGGFTFHYAEGGSYFSNDPKSCVNCHVMRDVYDGWQKASHHAVATCNDCHVPHELLAKYIVKAENGFWHSKGFTLQDFHEPIRIRPVSLNILNTNRVNCHQDRVNDILGHGRAGPEVTGCVHCHGAVGHGPQR